MGERVQEIRKETVFKAPIERVWEAVATAEGIAEWFMPNDFKAEVGHEFIIESQFERSKCKVLTVDRPNEVTFTWGDQGWVVSFLLEEQGDETTFTLIHGGWGAPDELMKPTSRTQAAVRDTMNGGWEKLVNVSLRKVVESHDRPTEA